MAEFAPAFEEMIRNEGGFVLHHVSGDRGGQTFAGIARNMHPTWNGWKVIDRGETGDPSLMQMVREFYKEHFWDKIKGDDHQNQGIAENLFDFAVNAGLRTASKLGQKVVGATPDGIIGDKSVQRFNEFDEEYFVAKYALAKIARYAAICTRTPDQKKFLLGWINRTLKAVA